MFPQPDPVQHRPVSAEPMLDLRRIKQFVILAETLNFTKAAERLHIAQPPLSVSIQKLEKELGVRLFKRGGAGGVTLTTSGHAVLPVARKLLFHNSQFLEAAASAASGTGGALTVGFVGSTTHGALQRIVRLFRAEYPGVELVLKEGTSNRILQLVEEGELDVGLVRLPLMRSAQVQIVPILTEQFIAALPAGNHLALKAELSLAELESESFVFYAATQAAGLHAMAILACQHAGFLPRITQEATQVQTVLSLVESGLGIALVPSIMQHTPNPRIQYRRISDIAEVANIGLGVALCADSPGPTALRFRDVAIEALASGVA